MQEIQAFIANLVEEIRELRRHIHAHPELSFEEYETSKTLQKALSQREIPFESGIVETGILACLDSGKPGKNILLRADMDALPIEEASGESFASKNPGIMHACGHDMHSSNLVGVLHILNTRKEQWSGKVYGFFQPGEEKLPGGARLALQSPLWPEDIDVALGCHVFPDLSVGKLGIRPGRYMASSDELHIEIQGKGGHAALPERAVDPISIGAQLVVHLQRAIARKLPADVPGVLSICSFQSGNTTNVIPDSCTLKGTFRCLDERWRSKIHAYITAVCEGIEQQEGCRIHLDIRTGYPALFNSIEHTQKVRSKWEQHLEPTNIIELPLRMTSEDFSFIAQRYPSVFFRFGTSPQGEEGEYHLHHPAFRADDSALRISMYAMVLAVFALQ